MAAHRFRKPARARHVRLRGSRQWRHPLFVQLFPGKEASKPMRSRARAIQEAALGGEVATFGRATPSPNEIRMPRNPEVVQACYA